MGDYYDAEYLSLIGPVFRHEAIVLLEAMVRQAIELGPQPASDQPANQHAPRHGLRTVELVELDRNQEFGLTGSSDSSPHRR